MLDKDIKRLDSYGNPNIYYEFKWNKRKHFPIITLQYLASEYNINYEEEMNITNIEAKRDLREIADIAYDLVMKNKRADSKDAFLYYIAKDEDLLFKVLELQVIIIRSYMMTGSISDIFDGVDYVIPVAINNFIAASGLNHPYWKVNLHKLPIGIDY